MKKRLWLLMFPTLIYAQDLSSLIASAQKHNQLLKASALQVASKHKALESQKSAYYPTLDVGGAYVTFDKVSAFQPGNTLNLFAKAGVDLFDGFRKSAQVKQKENAYTASQYDLIYLKKSLSLDIVKDFYNIKSAESQRKALQEKARQLQADIKKVKKFKLAGLAAQDYVDKLQSAYETNNYAVESLKLTIKTLKRYLSLKSGILINSLDESTFLNPKHLTYTPSEAIKSLQEHAKEITHSAKALSSIYYPNIRLEDTYGYYDYSRDDGLQKLGINQVDKQNKLAIVANLRLFDNGSIKKQKEALQIQRQAMQEKIDFQKTQEKIRYELSIDALKTAKLNIHSAQSALKAAQSVYKSIKAKFNAGIVDQITYLDALSQKTASQARFKKAQNDYEIAKANFYFAANKNLKDYIK